jgi:hypothetical protein
LFASHTMSVCTGPHFLSGSKTTYYPIPGIINPIRWNPCYTTKAILRIEKILPLWAWRKTS